MRLGRAAALVAVVALTACAGEDRLSREELVERASQICRDANSRLDDLPEPQGIDGIAAYARDAEKIVGGAVGDLRELEPPEELEADYGRWLDANDDILAALEDLQEVDADADMTAVVERGGAANTRADRIAARELELPACAED